MIDVDSACGSFSFPRFCGRAHCKCFQYVLQFPHCTNEQGRACRNVFSALVPWNSRRRDTCRFEETFPCLAGSTSA